MRPAAGGWRTATVVSVEHPTGEFSVELEVDGQQVTRAALLLTARPIMRGEVLLPS